jgi:hypothetical protein
MEQPMLKLALTLGLLARTLLIGLNDGYDDNTAANGKKKKKKKEKK